MIICRSCNSSFRRFIPRHTPWSQAAKVCPACGMSTAKGSFLFAPDLTVLIQQDVDGRVIAKFDLAEEYTPELPEQFEENQGFDGEEYPYCTYDVLFLADWITKQGMADITVDPNSVDSFTLLLPNEPEPLRVYQVNKDNSEATFLLPKFQEAISY